jgi:ligand-binding sensor domain-containing protein
MIQKTICILFSLCLLYTCKGQNKDINLSTIQKDSTPPKAISRNIIQDSKGNIWIAAFDGVFKYDGKTFTNVIGSVSKARFFSVLEDSKGTLWFGSIGSGVYQYDGKSFKNWTTKDGLISMEITSIFEDKDGHIWIGAAGGVSRYNGKTIQNYILSNDSLSLDISGGAFNDSPPTLRVNSVLEVNSIIEDKSGKLWFATRGNTFVFDGQTFEVVRDNDFTFKNVRCLIEDTKGNIWLGGNDGLWKFDGNKYTQLNHMFVGHIYEDSNNFIWTSSQKEGSSTWVLSRYDKTHLSGISPKPVEIKSDDNMYFGIMEAKNGSIWFGSLNGVYQYLDGNIIDFN